VSEVATDPGAAAEQWYHGHLAGSSAEALRWATRAARSGWLPALRGELAELERLYLKELAPTHDALEGLRAFLEKRTPRWEDR
jgi:cyclohexa-1,5-dienecarbonyl-CoA hydratase